MVNYANGKLYRIVCNVTGEHYYGSTCQDTVAQRLTGHVRHFKSWIITGNGFYTSFPIIKRGNYSIILVETFPCKSKNELSQRERFYIENNECVNKVIPSQTHVEYLVVHKLEIAKQKQSYRQENIDKIKIQEKEYYEANRDVILKQKKEYNETNREKILLRRRELYRKKKLLKLELSHNEKT